MPMCALCKGVVSDKAGSVMTSAGHEIDKAEEALGADALLIGRWQT